MSRTARRFFLAAAIPLGLTLGGCGSMSTFDPTDLLNFLDMKKPLPGDRKAVFPEGVPGVSQGVPKELYVGQRPPDQPEAMASTETEDKKTETQAAAEREPPKPAARPKAPPRPRTAARPAPRPPAPAAAPPPAQAAAPARQQSAPQQQPAQSAGGVNWPAPPPAGTFSR